MKSLKINIRSFLLNNPTGRSIFKGNHKLNKVESESFQRRTTKPQNIQKKASKFKQFFELVKQILQYLEVLELYKSGQIIIFHQPRFAWNKGISLTKPPFGVRLCEVAIICPDKYAGANKHRYKKRCSFNF